jgi:RHS repeat-associated protein
MQTSFIYDCTPRFVHSCALTASRSTGKERDAESGLDNFGARYFGSNMGRFMSPDPFIPFNLKRDAFQEWIGNPQHWNKYAYVLNNPLKFTDPTGMTETVYYRLDKNATDEQKKFFNDHKDAILKAIGDKLNAAGIKDVVFRDAATLTTAQQSSIISNAPKGVALLTFANKSFGGWTPDSGTYGGSAGDRSAVLVGNLQSGSPDSNTLVFRLGEVSSHELGHDMGFFSRGATSSFMQFWNHDLMNEGQGMPTSPRNFDMTIPQNRQTVDDINKLPPYTPH